MTTKLFLMMLGPRYAPPALPACFSFPAVALLQLPRKIVGTSDGVGGRFSDQSRKNGVVATMEELKAVGLHNMPKKWYEQTQRVLWPLEEPLETFLQRFCLETRECEIDELSVITFLILWGPFLLPFFSSGCDYPGESCYYGPELSGWRPCKSTSTGLVGLASEGHLESNIL